MSKKFTITLARECGAGATHIAQELSRRLGIPYYDKDIFRMVSDKSGVLEEFFRVNNERPGNNFLYKIIKTLKPDEQKPSIGKDIVSPDNLYRFQSELIRELADNETSIIIGRAADYVLRNHEDVVSVFVCGSVEGKIQRLMDTFSITRLAAIERMKATDKQRAQYYSYYTGQKWDEAKNYDICLNTSNMTIEEAATLIECYLKQRGYIE